MNDFLEESFVSLKKNTDLTDCFVVLVARGDSLKLPESSLATSSAAEVTGFSDVLLFVNERTSFDHE